MYISKAYDIVRNEMYVLIIILRHFPRYKNYVCYESYTLNATGTTSVALHVLRKYTNFKLYYL